MSQKEKPLCIIEKDWEQKVEDALHFEVFSGTLLPDRPMGLLLFDRGQIFVSTHALRGQWDYFLSSAPLSSSNGSKDLGVGQPCRVMPLLQWKIYSFPQRNLLPFKNMYSALFRRCFEKLHLHNESTYIKTEPEEISIGCINPWLVTHHDTY